MARQLVEDWRAADLDPADRALCAWAVKLTRTPGAMTAGDVDALRAHGFDDAAITIAAQVVAHFNAINRIADGLGVDDEDWMTVPGRDEWLARRAAEETAP